eukprot:TRINITY_DN280_c1_g1_i1.p1 TRINITY_DN280_c1_g1~~TRINITY_DN280_c1_g1_i1.p1  ORF type:complete len:207 (+),score=37.78 TRINITY_DN280_c1_g1_i1:122-742(+)
MASSPVSVQLDVWSDIACPWCYVGKARLDSAIQNVKRSLPPAEVESLKVVVNWHAYMIDMKTQAGGEEYMAYNVRRWGSDGWTQSLRRAGAKNGLKFADWRWWPNTFHAHRLVHLASQAGRGSEAKQLLLEKTYEDGANVSDLAVLCDVGEALGLEGIREALESDAGKAEVIEEDRRAKSELNVRGVPYFLVDNRVFFSGAQTRCE